MIETQTHSQKPSKCLKSSNILSQNLLTDIVKTFSFCYISDDSILWPIILSGATRPQISEWSEYERLFDPVSEP